jgi:BNR repeat-containing family member
MKRIGRGIVSLGLVLCVQVAQAFWSPVQRVTWTSGESTNPAMAVDSNGGVHIAWSDATPGNWEIYYKASPDGGTTWGTAKRLTRTPDKSYRPDIAVVSGSVIHVVWYEETSSNREVYYSKSTNGGTTWSEAKKLAGTVGGNRAPVIAIYSVNVLHVVWYGAEPGNSQIYYRRSLNGGATWSAAKRLNWSSGNCFYPALAVDSTGGVHVVWYDYSPGNAEIYYKRSTDGGTTWSTSQRLSVTSCPSYDPDIAIDSTGVIHVVWHENDTVANDIYYKKSTDGGLAWTVKKRLTWTSGNSWSPALAIDSLNTVHIVWHDFTPGNWEVFYKNGADGGTTWGTAQRLTRNSESSLDPAIATDSNDFVHVVWTDYAPGNGEIYYRKGM